MWESAEKVQKNDAGEYRALIGGEWVPVAKAQKSDTGEYRVQRTAPAAEEPSMLSPESLAANPITRFATGAAAPFMGAGEMLPGAAGKWFAENNRQLEQMKDIGKESQGAVMRAAGNTADFAGNVLSPGWLKAGKVMGPAKTFGGMASQGALLGAAGGLTAPIGRDDLESKVRASATGLGVGGVAGPVLGGAVRGVGNLFAPSMSQAAAERGAAKIANRAAGDDAAGIAADLRAAPSSAFDETAAQVVEPRRNPVFSALQGAWENRAPSAYDKNLQGQELLRKGSVSALNEMTDPTRQGILGAANAATQDMVRLPVEAGQLRGQAAGAVEDVRRMASAEANALGRAQRMEPINRLPSLVKLAADTGEKAAETSLGLGAAARVVEDKIGTYVDRGLKPLLADDIVSSISKVKTASENVTNDQLRLITSRLERAITRAKQPDGTVPAEALYTLRKTGINDTIEAVAGDNRTLAKRLSAGELLDIKKGLDEAIENAGGEGWKKYLADYSRVRGALERPKDRMESVLEMAPKGQPEVSRLLNEGASARIPAWFHPAITAANAAIRAGSGVAGESVNRAGANLMLPENVRRLGTLMQQNQAKPYGLLSDYIRYSGGVPSGLLNPQE